MICDLYETENLSLLHTLSNKEYDVGSIGNDTHTDYHKKFYNKLHSGWPGIETLYIEFVRDFVSQFIPEKMFLFQKFPSYRIHLPNNKAVTTWHYDSDALHGHPDGEINFVLPLTDMFSSNSIWVESFPGNHEFSAMCASFGDLIQFDGNKCTHGNKINTTGLTRISFDFRILPFSKYDPEYQRTSATSSQRFVEGEYYHGMDCR